MHFVIVLEFSKNAKIHYIEMNKKIFPAQCIYIYVESQDQMDIDSKNMTESQIHMIRVTIIYSVFKNNYLRNFMRQS